MNPRRNFNRGYQKLTVWQAAADLYVLTREMFREFPYDLRRVSSNRIASVGSDHRDIAEGSCRRSINGYLQFLNVALASLGEAVSGVHVCRRADQLSEAGFGSWDVREPRCGRVEVELDPPEAPKDGLFPVLERRLPGRPWVSSAESIVKESNAAQEEPAGIRLAEHVRPFQYSIIP